MFVTQINHTIIHSLTGFLLTDPAAKKSEYLVFQTI